MDRFHRWLRLGFVGVSLLLGVFSATSFGLGDVPGKLPRYKLHVGQELTYHGESDFNYTNGSMGNTSDWQAWVVKQNPDASWRVVVR